MNPASGMEINQQKTAPHIQGVIFDMDGVLTDTIEFHYQSWEKLAREEGIPFNRELNDTLRGLSRRDSLMQILGDRYLPEAKIEEMLELKNRYYLDFIDEMTPAHLLPGVDDLLNELRAAGMKTAIASASQNVRAVIPRLGIADRIDVVTNVYKVKRSKPAPDVFLHAAEQLEVSPNQCLVVEDAEAGVEAALAAGMWALGLGPVERVGAAHIVLPSLQGVKWEDILGKLHAAV